jgi:hypothetical protein
LGIAVVALISLWALDKLKVPEPIKRFGTAKLIVERQLFVITASLIMFWGFNVVRVVTGIYPS